MNNEQTRALVRDIFHVVDNRDDYTEEEQCNLIDNAIEEYNRANFQEFKNKELYSNE